MLPLWWVALACLPALAAAGEPGALRFVGPWPPALQQQLELALQALPRGLASAPGGPIELELDPAASDFGMGEGSDARPEWTRGGRRFHLYAYREPQDPRASYRLERLSPQERRTLWLRRALVHALVERWDARYRWSGRADWREINGWLAPFERPLTFREEASNDYAWAYSRRRGQTSAAEDLATFAEEALVPATSLRPDAVPVDDQVRCQELTKLRFLRGVLAPLGVALPPRGRCPAFDHWARLDQLDHLEVLFSAPSGAQLESLFGHLLLRRVYRPSGAAEGPATERVLQIAAMTGIGERLQTHLAKGLAGGYRTVFAEVPLSDILKQNVEVEQRTLRRWRLRLSPVETERVIERMWEAERRAFPRYYFFTDNCASQLLWLFNPALEPARRVERPGMFWVMPTATLDGLAEANPPLLEPLPAPFLSRRIQAQRALDDLAEVELRLRQAVPPKLDAAWERLFQELRAPDPASRQTAYESLPTLLAAFRPRGGSAARPELVRELVEDVTMSERYPADRAGARQNALARATVQVPPTLHLPTSDELLAQREHLFEREDAPARERSELAQYLKFQDYLTTLPHRERTAAEQKAWALAQAELRTFDRWTSVEGDLLEREPGPVPSVETAEPAPSSGILHSSGYGYFAAGLTAPASQVLQLTLESALVQELMGDERERGFGPGTELRLLDAQSTWTLRDGAPSLPNLELTVVGFRSFVREPVTMRQSILDWVGWGGQAEVERDLALSPLQRGRVGLQLYGIPLAGDAYRGYLAVGLGPSLGFDMVALPVDLRPGPRAELTARIPLWGHHANGVRAEVAYLPSWRISHVAPGALEQDVRASSWLELHAASFGAHDLVLGLGAELEWRQELGAARTDARGVAKLQWM